MMHTGDHHERRARTERALAIHAAWQGLRHLLRLRRPQLKIRDKSDRLPFNAGCASTG